MSSATRKRKSTISIISYSLSRISRSTMAWVFFTLGFVSLNATIVATAMIVKPNDVSNFKVNIQYVIIIFINVFLFLFTVMNVVKLYSDQLADGSFLLLVSKPYKRFSIFMCQFAAIWIAQIMFILLSLSSSLLTGFALSQFANMSWLFMPLLKLLLQLAIYTLLFSVVTICGAVLLAVMLSTQVVFLILVIFCSLFLMGGMPYSLFKEIANSTQIVLKDNRTSTSSDKVRSIYNIKKAILFKQKLQQNKIRYQNVTKKIYDLFEKNPNLLESDQSNARNKLVIEMLDKDMKVYRPTAFKEVISGKIEAWDVHPSNELINGKEFEVTITYSKYFKSRGATSSANKLDPKNVYHQEILGMIKEHEDIGLQVYIDGQTSNAANFLRLDEDNSFFIVKNLKTAGSEKDYKSYFYGKGEGSFEKGPEDHYDLFKRKKESYKLDDASLKKYEQIYSNPVPYVINTIATIVADTIRERNEISILPVSQNRNFRKYLSAMDSYQIINYLNRLLAIL